MVKKLLELLEKTSSEAQRQTENPSIRLDSVAKKAFFLAAISRLKFNILKKWRVLEYEYALIFIQVMIEFLELN